MAVNLVQELCQRRGYTSTDDPTKFVNQEGETVFVFHDPEIDVSRLQLLDQGRIVFIYKELGVQMKRVNIDNVELFQQDLLSIRLRPYRFVPLMEKVSGISNVARDKLPKLFVTDPISQTYGFKIGDVVLIHRDTSLGYRQVVASTD